MNTAMPTGNPAMEPIRKRLSSALSTARWIEGTRMTAIIRLSNMVTWTAEPEFIANRMIGPAMTPKPMPVAACNSEATSTAACMARRVVSINADPR